MQTIDKTKVNEIIDGLLGNNNLTASPEVWYGLHKIKNLQPVATDICVGDNISRQAAIDAIAQCTNCGDEDTLRKYVLKHNLDNGWTGGILEALDAAKDLPPAQPEPPWIPVSERLPNHDEYIKNNGLFNVSDGNRSYSEWFDIYDKQMFGEPTMAGFRVDYAVTAWMPLPKPFEGGAE